MFSDDPAPAASRLRQAGVRVIALGIGQHINIKELVDMVKWSNLQFIFKLLRPTTRNTRLKI